MRDPTWMTIPAIGGAWLTWAVDFSHVMTDAIIPLILALVSAAVAATQLWRLWRDDRAGKAESRAAAASLREAKMERLLGRIEGRLNSLMEALLPLLPEEHHEVAREKFDAVISVVSTDQPPSAP